MTLIETDPTKLSHEELEKYLTQLRSLRACPQTTRAKTERAPRKNTPTAEEISELCGWVVVSVLTRHENDYISNTATRESGRASCGVAILVSK